MLHQATSKHFFRNISISNTNVVAKIRKFSNTSSSCYAADDISSLTDTIKRSDELEWLNKNIQSKNHKYKYNTFRSLIDSRRDQARNTLLVQVKSKESANELQNYCNKNIGEVKELHYYENEKSRTFQNFFVVEFDDVSAVGRAMFEVAGFGETPNYSIPISSPFMWFASDRLSNVQYQAEDKSQITTVSHKIVSSTAVKQHLESQAIEQKEALQSKNNLNHYLLRYRDLDEQMRAYHDLTKISEVGTRLRFLACEQIELALTGMFPNVEVLPFGSSVNSYGKSNSDLDMCLKLIKESKNKGENKEKKNVIDPYIKYLTKCLGILLRSSVICLLYTFRYLIDAIAVPYKRYPIRTRISIPNTKIL